ncbi:MAG: hypothetical protein HY746_03710 [Elusimicrobia bacterium]|nr:hypothetical protein [Elusimicrobiota bacterium]
MNVIVTLGATREYIDAVRFISNASTGATGSALADFFASKGFRVSALCAANSIKPKNKKVEILEFSDFSDLNGKIKNLLKTRSFDIFIHCAAVSDYSVRSPCLKTKLDSGSGTLKIILKRNFKIVERIKRYARANPSDKKPEQGGIARNRCSEHCELPEQGGIARNRCSEHCELPEQGGIARNRCRELYERPYLAAFKLTCAAGKKEILSAVSKLKSADIVVHNDINEKGFFHLYKNGSKTADCRGTRELAKKILKEIP